MREETDREADWEKSFSLCLSLLLSCRPPPLLPLSQPILYQSHDRYSTVILGIEMRLSESTAVVEERERCIEKKEALERTNLEEQRYHYRYHCYSCSSRLYHLLILLMILLRHHSSSLIITRIIRYCLE